MPEINICNSSDRDAVVTIESVFSPLRVRWLDEDGRQARSIRVLKSTIDRDIDHLAESCGGIENVAKALIESDPEIDIESVGTILTETSRVFLDPNRELVHRIQQFEIVRNPDGSERERRVKEVVPQNVSADVPLKWSGVFIDKRQVVQKFIFSNKLQLMHINGLTFDFLYGMARELEAKNAMMLLGAGPNSKAPLILRRGSIPYRGFLEGRTDGDRYLLLLHLSNMEMKTPANEEPTS